MKGAGWRHGMNMLSSSREWQRTVLYRQTHKVSHAEERYSGDAIPAMVVRLVVVCVCASEGIGDSFFINWPTKGYLGRLSSKLRTSTSVEEDATIGGAFGT